MAARSFATIADAFLREEYETSPVMASSLGLTEYDEDLDDLSADAIQRKEAADAGWLSELRAIDEATLAPADRIDRDFLLSILRGREIVQPRAMWKRQPATYLNAASGGVFTLFLHRLRPERELADAARARLERVPLVMDAGMTNLDFAIVPPVYLERGIGQAGATAKYLRALLPAEVKDPGLRAKVAAAGDVAAEAVERFRDLLVSRRGTAHGDFAIGEAMYTALLREKELLAHDARSLRERGREQWELLTAEANEVAKQIDGSGDWRQLCERLNLIHAADPDGMRREYEEWTERARSFLRAKRLVTLPEGERCLVEPSPPFQRPIIAVASYNRPPAFTDSLTGHFFVPYPPDGEPPQEVQKRLEGNCRDNIATTSVHEAYPGHHWHLVMAKSNPSKVRQTFSTAYFSEGWALYAERMMREQGFFEDPKTLLYQYEATIFRAARIVVDTSLHTGEMTFDEAVTFMREKGNLSEPNAKAEVGRYCSWPTQASSYLTGMLEILDIRTRYLARKGATGTDALREFHDAIASSGAMPTALAERAITA